MKKQSLAILVTNNIVQDERMRRIARAYTEKQFDVAIIGRRKSDSLPLLEEGYSQVRLSVWFTKGILFYLEIAIRHFLYLLRQRPDIVYAVDADTLLAGAIYRRWFSCALIYDAHEWFTEVPELLDAPLKRSIWSRIEKFGVRQSDYQITVNDSLAIKFDKVHHKPFLTVRNTPYLSSSVLSDRVEGVVVYLGVLNQGRMLEKLIDYFKNQKKFTFWIIGEGDLSQALRKRAGDSSSISFLGWKTHDEIKAILSRAWVGVNLLEAQSKSYHYSLANKCFDYIHAGLPAIHMDFPEYRRIHEESPIGTLIHEVDTVALDEALLLLSDHRYYARVEQSLEALRKKYNWENEKSNLPLL